MSIMIFNAVLTNRYIGTDELFVLGGSFTSPFIFIFGDIIAEIYGYRTARYIIFSGFACQTIFVLICQVVVNAPHPELLASQSYNAYLMILGPSLMRINFSGFAAYMLANLINAKILTRWKILLKGKKFWLRSLGASAFSEAVYTIIAIIMMQINTIQSSGIVKVIILSFLIKIFYSALFAMPANLIVNFVKIRSGIDMYDFEEKFTPFKYLKMER